MNRIVLSILFTLFGFSVLVPALFASREYSSIRDYVITSFGLEDGLPQSTVNSLLQTTDGYLWIGTHGGLVRFDGVTFRVYDQFNTPALISDRIITLFEDNKGNLWIGSETGGLTKKVNGEFISYDLTTHIEHRNVVSITEDLHNNIWVATTGSGVIQIDGDKMSHFTTADGLMHDIVSKIYRGIDGTIHAITALGISTYKDGKFYPLINAEVSGIREIHFIFEESPGKQWIGTRGHGLYLMNNGKVEGFSESCVPSSSQISEVFKDSNGNLWIATTEGILRYNEGVCISYRNQQGLSDINVLSITEDHEGTI